VSTTLETSHCPKGWLNTELPRKRLFIHLTRETSRCPMRPSNAQCANVDRRLVNLLVDQ
jgi:hypothetical protein